MWFYFYHQRKTKAEDGLGEDDMAPHVIHLQPGKWDNLRTIRTEHTVWNQRENAFDVIECKFSKARRVWELLH